MQNSAQLEKLMGVRMPSDYKEFIDKTGYLCLNNLGIEVYGYMKDFDIEKIPCVVAATMLNKKAYALEDSEIVISHTGFEEMITILDCNAGKVSELGFDGVRRVKAKSFSEWLSQMTSQNSPLL